MLAVYSDYSLKETTAKKAQFDIDRGRVNEDNAQADSLESALCK